MHQLILIRLWRDDTQLNDILQNAIQYKGFYRNTKYKQHVS
jgi:hypothetical protein